MKQKILIATGYLVFFIFAFLISLYLTFNPAQIKGWLLSNVNQQGFNLSLSQLDKYRLSGISAREITLQTPTGRNIKIDQLKARLFLLPLFLGRKKIGFQMTMSGGKLIGQIELNPRGYKTEFNIQKVNLANIRSGSETGFWIDAKLSGKGNLNLVPKNNPKNWSGKIAAELSSGTIPTFSYKSVQVPAIKIEQAKLEVELVKGIAQIKTFELKSPDFPIQGTGQIEFRTPLPNSLVQLEAKVNPSSQFLEQVKMLEAMLPPDRKVTYRGTLGGLLSGY